MDAQTLPSSANHDPIVGQLLRFTAAHGISLDGTGPEPSTLDPVWTALRAAGLDSPGLAYAAWADTSTLGGTLAAVLSNSPDLGAMLTGLQRFHPLLGRDEITLRRTPAALSVSLRTPAGGPAHPDTVDATFAMLTRIAYGLSGAYPTAVRLRRAAPANPQAYRASLGARVSFEQPTDGCTFAIESLAATNPQADPALYALVTPYAQRRVAQQAASWTIEVTRLLGADPNSIPQLRDVAQALMVSTRTLQTRLASEGHRFELLADAARRERALGLLHTDTPITQIAARVGFATPAAFVRAFRRWTGQTPTGYRSTLPS